MFCKWCGADLPRSELKCPRCGKEVPALSHCGGFYDLVPTAKPSKPPVDPPKPPIDPNNTDSSVNRHKKTTPKKKSIAPLLAFIAFLLVVVMLFVLSSRLSESLALIEQQQQMLEELIRQNKTSPADTEPTETDSGASAPLGNLHSKFTFDLDTDSDIINAPRIEGVDGYSFTPGNDPRLDGVFSHIWVNEAESSKGVDIKVIYGDLESGSFQLSADIILDSAVFSDPAGAGIYQWYIYNPADPGDLRESDTDPDSGTTRFTISPNDNTMFKLVYTVQLAAGGSVTIEIVGIQIPASYLSIVNDLGDSAPSNEQSDAPTTEPADEPTEPKTQPADEPTEPTTQPADEPTEPNV